MNGWIIETMVAATLLMVAVLALRAPVARLFGPRAAYLLWAMPALRMILPPLPASWMSGPGSDAVAQTGIALGAPAVLAPLTVSAGGAGSGWVAILTFLWVGGAIIFIAYHLLAYRQFKQGVMADALPLFTQGRIPVSASRAVTSPIALGIFGRAVVVPADFEERFDAVEQRLALHHEVTHHHRGDLPINLGALIILALHWFNPVAHFAHRAFRHDQEAACDAIVLAGADAVERHAYGNALYKSATGPVPFGVCAMGTTTTLKARLRGIIAHASRPERLVLGSTLALIMVGTSLFLTASIGKATLRTGTAPSEAQHTKAWAVATSAKAEAEAALGAQEADLGEAEGRAADSDSARAEIETKRAAIDASRDAIREANPSIEVMQQTLAALPQPPAPPAPPAPPSTTESKAMPGDAPGAAPDLQRRSASAECSEQAHHRQIVSANEGQIQVVVIDCDGVITTLTNASTQEGLVRARARIAALEVLSKEQRAIATEAVERAMKKLKAQPPPFSLQ
jgi:bla regulator protein blaR1